MAIDGKAQKGRLKFEENDSYPIHAVSIVEHETGIVLTQGHVEKTDKEVKSEQIDKEVKSEQTDKKKGSKEKAKEKKAEEKEKEEQEKKKQKSELAVAYRLILQIDAIREGPNRRRLILPKMFVRGPSFGRWRLFVYCEEESASTI